MGHPAALGRVLPVVARESRRSVALLSILTVDIRPESPDRSEFIQPDYWQRVYIHVFPDMRTIYRARVFSRAVASPADSDEIADKAYRVVVCDLPRIAEHFPEVEERTDKQTAELLASRTK